MTSLTTLRTQLNEDYIRDPNNRVWNLNTKDRALNKGYTQVQKDLNWSAGSNENNTTSTTVAGSELYNLPSDFVRMSLVKYDGEVLDMTTRKTVKSIDETTPTGTPHSYYLYNEKIGLYPIPDAAKTLDLTYYQSEATITSSQDSTLPDITDDAVCLYAAYKLYLGVRDANSAQMFYNDYMNEIQKVRLALRNTDENITAFNTTS